MTEERRTPDSSATDDPRVSEAYRDLARERTPEHLDQAVLREATRAARPRYSRLRLWTRPAAWAAIVLLSATFLLQVSNFEPAQESAMPQVLELEERAAQREAAEPAGAVEDRTYSDAPAIEEVVVESLESASRDSEMFKHAEDMARMQQGPNEALAGSQPAALQAITVTGQRIPACDDEARATPESWLDCIRELEEVGMDEAASQERTLLTEAFPDFEAP